MSDAIKTVLFVFLAVDSVALLAFIVYKIIGEIRRNKVRHFGDRAEEIVAETCRREFPGAVLLNDVFLKNGNSVTQIDHILISKWGVAIIETKSHNGRIIPGEREWVQMYQDKVVRFHSPIRQNESHVRALQKLLKSQRVAQDVKVLGVVVFTSRKVHFEKRQKGVIRLSALSPYVKTGGTRTDARGGLTAPVGMRYLNRKKIVQIEKIIRKHSVKGFGKRRYHEKLVRRMDRHARY